MKAAACWFAQRWSVRTRALGEPVERTISFDIPTITAEHVERLPIVERPAHTEWHGAILTLEHLNVRPRAKTIDKIKRHLASIYRVFLRDASLEIIVNDDPLAYLMPEILEAPHFSDPRGPVKKWT
jgi:hypothetical protein